MKPALIFQQYVWIVNTLRKNGRMSFQEISERWIDEAVAEGDPLVRSKFNRHRDAILDMFGIVIECDNDYRYYIYNSDVLDDDTLEHWMLNTMTVGGVLADSLKVKDRIILENVPVGEEYLMDIVNAIKSNLRLKVNYQRFGHEPYDTMLSPYAIKLFHQRWYLLARNDKYVSVYSFDRIHSVQLSSETFQMPADFSPQNYFSEYFGVLTDSRVPMERVEVKVYGMAVRYLETLPLHTSQRMVSREEDHAVFAFNLRPTIDFCEAVFSHGPDIEVLKPEWLRLKMHESARNTCLRYAPEGALPPKSTFS